MTINEYLAAERADIEAQQRQVLARGSINNPADLRTFCRLEGRLEQLLLIEAWIASQVRETVSV